MSSTLRGSTREASDYYVTPHWAIVDFLNAFNADHPELAAEKITLDILDPCAGGDEKRTMVYPDALLGFKPWSIRVLDTMDIREDSKADIKSDYLKEDVRGFHNIRPEIIITNPPFSLAMPIIEKALHDVNPGGWVIMLLRLNFFGGQKEKKAFFSRIGLPVACYVHRKRMSFSESGKTDSIEYCHMVCKTSIAA